jgi:putative PIG3 family NAD(P)H quinone oxidoreductase
MRTIVIVDGTLELADRPTPEPTGREVRVRVTASGVNRADLLQRGGRYPAPAGVPNDVPGLEFAGVVDALGPKATRWHPGDRVRGLVGGGAHAEYLVVEDDQLIAVPDALDDVAAGACVEVFATAHDALVTQAGLRSGECVLIHAVGSGVGTAAVQLVTAIGARAIGTTRTAEKLDAAAALGLVGGSVVMDPSDRHIAAELAELGPPDVILDLVGGDYVELDCHVAAPGARIVLVGLLAGARCDVPLGQLLAKRLELRGTVLRSRPAHEKAAVALAFEREVVPLLAAGRVAPVLAETYPLDQAQEAYDRVASNEIVGKVTLTIA